MNRILHVRFVRRRKSEYLDVPDSTTFDGWAFWDGNEIALIDLEVAKPIDIYHPYWRIGDIELYTATLDVIEMVWLLSRVDQILFKRINCYNYEVVITDDIKHIYHSLIKYKYSQHSEYDIYIPIIKRAFYYMISAALQVDIARKRDTWVLDTSHLPINSGWFVWSVKGKTLERVRVVHNSTL